MADNNVLLSEGDNAVNRSEENLLDSSPPGQFLQDIRAVTRRISHLIRHSKVEGPEQTVVDLLHLALSIESAFSVWYRGHALANSRGEHNLKRWAESAAHDAEAIAQRLQEITGKKEYQGEWLPSMKSPPAVDQWHSPKTFGDERDAQRLALVGYERLVRFMQKHDPPTAALLKGIADGREERLADLTYRLSHPALKLGSSFSSSSRRR
jgi:hypothetical protein